MDPGRTDLQTFLTPVRTGDDVIVNLIEVCAFCEAHNVIRLAMFFSPETSPAFQRWVSITRKKQVPPGTKETRGTQR